MNRFTLSQLDQEGNRLPPAPITVEEMRRGIADGTMVLDIDTTTWDWKSLFKNRDYSEGINFRSFIKALVKAAKKDVGVALWLGDFQKSDQAGVYTMHKQDRIYVKRNIGRDEVARIRGGQYTIPVHSDKNGLVLPRDIKTGIEKIAASKKLTPFDPVKVVTGFNLLECSVNKEDLQMHLHSVRQYVFEEIGWEELESRLMGEAAERSGALH